MFGTLFECFFFQFYWFSKLVGYYTIYHNWFSNYWPQGDGQRGLASYDSWGNRESDTTERLNWTDDTFTSNFIQLLWIWGPTVILVFSFWKLMWKWSYRYYLSTDYIRMYIFNCDVSHVFQTHISKFWWTPPPYCSYESHLTLNWLSLLLLTRAPHKFFHI